jgi:hypothetical protein
VSRKPTEHLPEATVDQLVASAPSDADAARALAWHRKVEQARRDLVSVDRLINRATLVVRCDDCRGRVVMHVGFVEGQPLVWTRLGRGTREARWPSAPVANDGGGVVSILDAEFDVWAYCDFRWCWSGSDVLDATPGPGQARVDQRVRHPARSAVH